MSKIEKDMMKSMKEVMMDIMVKTILLFDQKNQMVVLSVMISVVILNVNKDIFCLFIFHDSNTRINL